MCKSKIIANKISIFMATTMLWMNKQWIAKIRAWCLMMSPKDYFSKEGGRVKVFSFSAFYCVLFYLNKKINNNRKKSKYSVWSKHTGKTEHGLCQKTQWPSFFFHRHHHYQQQNNLTSFHECEHTHKRTFMVRIFWLVGLKRDKTS